MSACGSSPTEPYPETGTGGPRDCSPRAQGMDEEGRFP